MYITFKTYQSWRRHSFSDAIAAAKVTTARPSVFVWVVSRWPTQHHFPEGQLHEPRGTAIRYGCSITVSQTILAKSHV